MDYKASISCYNNLISIRNKFPPEVQEAFVNLTRVQLGHIEESCIKLVDFEDDSDVENAYSQPMVWIGIYISVASLFCILAMAADLWNGFSHKKFWFPSKYFSLNALSITVIAVAMKLPVDLNSQMPTSVDQATKIGSLVFMCTMIANLMPSLASIDNNELPANVIGLVILVITIIVNVIIELITGVIAFYEVLLPVAMLLFLLIVLISFAISVPISKQILELKYQAISKTILNDQDSQDTFKIQSLEQHLKRHAIMVQTGSPQFVMAGNVLSCASGVICGIGMLIYIWLLFPFILSPYIIFTYGSQYKWSMCAIFITQFIGVLVGSIAPIFRCITAITSYKPFARWNIKHLMVFKVEKYWTQKLYEWKESHISFLLGGHRSRSLFRNVKKPILILWIRIQMATVVACKMICFIPILIIIWVTYCSKYLKGSVKGLLLDTLPINGNTNEDLSRYVLLLEEKTELAGKTMKRISCSVNHLIQTGEKEQDNNLLKLLERSTGFEGVLVFDSYQVQQSLKLPNSWSLPIATLTCIALALPTIDSEETDNLFKSVVEGLSYTHLVDESLNSACKYPNVQKAAMTLRDEVEGNCRWLGNTLEKRAYEGKTSKEILESFAHKAEEILKEDYNTTMMEKAEEILKEDYNTTMMEKVPQKLVIANSMKRIAQTIITAHNISQITIEQLFALLSGMIADILVACFTNLPAVITMKCHENAIEKREASVEIAARLLGRTTEIIKLIAKRELPLMDPDKLAFIDEWRIFLRRIPKNQLSVIQSQDLDLHIED